MFALHRNTPHFAKMKCYYCGSYNLMHMWNNYTCRDCCTEQNTPDLVVNEYDIHYEELCEKPRNEKVKDVFDDIENTDAFTMNVIQCAKDMFNDYVTSFNLIMKTDIVRSSFAYACVYYAGRQNAEVSKSRKYFEAFCDSIEFNKACKQILEKPLDKYAHLFTYSKSQSKIHDECMRMVHMFGYTRDDIKVLRRNLYKLCDMVQEDHECKTTHLTTLCATLIYMAHMFAKMKITMTKVAKTLNITIASMIKVEKGVKEVIMRRQTRKS